MMDGLTLSEIELKLFLLKKRTRKAIERNEATILRLKRMDHERDDFLASLEGRLSSILEDDSLYNTSQDTSVHTEHSDPEPVVVSSSSSEAQSSIDETRQEHSTFSDVADEGVRNGAEQDSSSSDSFESSVSTTASSTASRVEAFLQMAATEERRILDRLDRLRSSICQESIGTTMARNSSAGGSR